MKGNREAADGDLYEILGVERTATADQIRRAYRKLARKYHPDLHPGDRGSEEKFKRITVAHQVLADPEKRRIYDEFGLAGLKVGFDPRRARAFQRSRRAPSGSFRQRPAGSAGWGGLSFDDIINELFTGVGQRGAGRGRGRDLELELEVDLFESLRGARKAVTVARTVVCGGCSGVGLDTRSGSVCPACRGRGKTRLGPAAIGLERSCPACQGFGRTGAAPCTRCKGRRRVRRTERLMVAIPPGVRDGGRVRVAGKGDEGLEGGRAGDLLLSVRVKPHPFIERRGSDLILNLPLTVGEAMRGALVNVPTINGTVRLKVPGGSQSGQKLRLKGKGVGDPQTGTRGDLYVRLLVHVPAVEADAAREAIDLIERSYGENPRKHLRI